jgi:hypothetical protein
MPELVNKRSTQPGSWILRYLLVERPRKFDKQSAQEVLGKYELSYRKSATFFQIVTTFHGESATLSKTIASSLAGENSDSSNKPGSFFPLDSRADHWL